MVRGCDQTIGGERFASGVNLITRTKTANNRFVSERRRTRECGRAIYYYSVGKSYIGSYRTLFLFSYSPILLPLRPPSGYPLFDPSLVRWSIPYSTLMAIRTVTYHSMAVEMIYRFLLTFGDPYIICLYQLCYDCGGNSTAFSILCYSNHRQRTTKTFLINTYSPKQEGDTGAPSKISAGIRGHLQRFTSTKQNGRAEVHILRPPQPGIYIGSAGKKKKKKNHAKDNKE